MSSIRRFLVVVLLATITLINFLAALHGYRTSMAEAEQLFDQHLADVAAVLAVAADGRDTLAALVDSPGEVVFQVWQDGALVLASTNAPAAAMAALQPGYAETNFDGYRWRTYSFNAPDSQRWILVAERTDQRFALAENVILESVLPILFGLPLVGLLIWFIVGRSLSPLRDLADEVGNKRSDDLAPVDDTDPPQELAQLIDSFNGLLHRLKAAFDREKRFAADAAHELRTPISVLKVQLHNLLRDARDDDAQLQALASAVDRMERSVEQVLELYRTAPEQFASSFTELDLASTARQVIAEMYPQLQARKQQIELVAEAASMRGDEFAMRTLLRNLLENASKYSGAGGSIRVLIEPGRNFCRLTVEDSGPGIPASQREKVLERFVRGDGAHNDSGVVGSGIGLAIVKHVADIHDAEISLHDSGFDSGLAVKLLFPVGSQPHAASGAQDYR